MHELPVAEQLLEIALRHGESSGARKITSLNLVIGQLSSIVDDSVAFYWEMIAEDTIASGSTLHFDRLPVELVCLDCQTSYTPIGEDFACPNCKSLHVKVRSGEEFYLESIEIET